MTSARSLLPEADVLEVLGKAFVVLHERAAVRAGKPRWADKNPENVLYLPDWERLLNDRWLFLHVVRNPLDTLASIKEMRFPLAIPAELGTRIRFYQQYTQAGLDWGATQSDRYYRVVYEEFVRAPQAAVEGMMDWLDETFEPGQLEFNRFPQQSGLEDPKIASTSEIHNESIGRWRSLLSDEEAWTTWRETRDLWAVIDTENRYADSISPFSF